MQKCIHCVSEFKPIIKPIILFEKKHVFIFASCSLGWASVCALWQLHMVVRLRPQTNTWLNVTARHFWVVPGDSAHALECPSAGARASNFPGRGTWETCTNALGKCQERMRDVAEHCREMFVFGVAPGVI